MGSKQSVSQTTEPTWSQLHAYPQCLDTQKLITPSFEAMDVIKAALPVQANPDQYFATTITTNSIGILKYHLVLDVEQLPKEVRVSIDTVQVLYSSTE